MSAPVDAALQWEALTVESARAICTQVDAQTVLDERARPCVRCYELARLVVRGARKLADRDRLEWENVQQQRAATKRENVVAAVKRRKAAS